MRKHIMRILVIVLSVMLITGMLPLEDAHADSIVRNRIEKVRDIYPSGSHMNQKVKVLAYTRTGESDELSYFTNVECAALVAYTTLRVFHNPYVPSSTAYEKKGRAKTSSKSQMKKLFKRAKRGDVIAWSMASGPKKSGIHYAIYLSSTSKGVYVYEANFGGGNRVYYHHFWSWNHMRSWTGASRVSVYHPRNYNAVNKGSGAKKLSRGDTFEYKGITYKVTSTSMKCGKIKVVKKSSSAGKTPKAIGINKYMSRYLQDHGDLIEDPDGIEYGKKIRYRAYYEKVPAVIKDEQLYKVVK